MRDKKEGKLLQLMKLMLMNKNLEKIWVLSGRTLTSASSVLVMHSNVRQKMVNSSRGTMSFRRSK